MVTIGSRLVYTAIRFVPLTASSLQPLQIGWIHAKQEVAWAHK